MKNETYRGLNAQLNLFGDDGRIQLDKDKEAAHAYFLEVVNPNTVFFHTLKEKVDYMVDEGMWDEKVVRKFDFQVTKELFKRAYDKKFRFPTFLGAYKFYSQYAMKTLDGTRWLERFEDRVVLNALAYSSNIRHAETMIDLIMAGVFQPATPTFLNAGRVRGGKPVSCFLLRIEDNMESIARGIHDSLQLSKNGGGVALLLSNIREEGAPIKGIENQSSGIIPIMKLLEDSFSYANQLGARQGAGAVYLSAHHPDIMKFLDTKRENADEKIRIKTLSLGVVVPDVLFELAREGADLALLSPYDVEYVYGVPVSDLSIDEKYWDMVGDDRIRKEWVSARKLLQRISEIQFESGYPYLMFESAANEANPAPNLGRINMSNLCSEIMQPNAASKWKPNGEMIGVGADISCNLGSVNIAKIIEYVGMARALSPFAEPPELVQGTVFFYVVKNIVEFLSAVADVANQDGDQEINPSITKGNVNTRAIGIGQMNLHGYLISQGIKYDSPEARAFFSAYMRVFTQAAILSSQMLCFPEEGEERGAWGPAAGWDLSDWANGKKQAKLQKAHLEANKRHEGVDIPAPKWLLMELADLDFTRAKRTPMANLFLQAIPPTGSISYINHSTASIHPVTAAVETRKEGKIGRAYYPAYGLTAENYKDVETAYQTSQKAVIDMYAEAAPFVDQGISATLFLPDTATTADLTRLHMHAWRRQLKSLYYVRILQKAIEGTNSAECVSCSL